jgi:hypothetical protein
MKHFTKLLSISALAMPLVISAQVNVTTATTKRVAVLEEYTGNYCTFCPDGHKIAQDIESAKPNNFIALKIQTGGFSSTDPIFGGTLETPTGEIIAASFPVGGYPSGSVNRKFNDASRADWETHVNSITSENSPVNIHIGATLDITTRQLNVTAEYYYTANEPTGTNYLHIGYYQDNVPAFQYNSPAYNPTKVYITDISLYEFDHCFRDNLTPTPASGTWGNLISNTNMGSTAIVNLPVVTLPAGFNGFDLEAGAIKVFAYISKTDKGEIITAAKTTPVFSNWPTANDVEVIYSNIIADEKCIGETGSTSVQVLFGNKGENTVSSLGYDIDVNGTVNSSSWSGTLLSTDKKVFTSPSYNFTYVASNDIDVELTNPNGVSDDNTADNSISKSFNGSSLTYETQYIRVGAKVDKYGASESRWTLRNSAGTKIAESGKLENSTVNEKLVILPDGISDCYQFEITDSYGDGWGTGNYLEVYKVDAGVEEFVMSVNASGAWKRKTAAGEFNNVLSINENVNSAVKLYPNPTIGDATLEFNVSTLSTVTVDVVNTIGQKVISKNLGSVNGSQKITLESNQLESGLYFVTIKMGDNVLTQKLTVSK